MESIVKTVHYIPLSYGDTDMWAGRFYGYISGISETEKPTRAEARALIEHPISTENLTIYRDDD